MCYEFQLDQFPDGLIPQLVEHCIGIAEVMGSNPFKASFVLGSIFRDAQVVYITAMILHVFTSFFAVKKKIFRIFPCILI